MDRPALAELATQIGGRRARRRRPERGSEAGSVARELVAAIASRALAELEQRAARKPKPRPERVAERNES